MIRLLPARADRPVLLVALGAGLALAGLSLVRYATFHAGIDLTYYVRLVWGVGHGLVDLPLVNAPHVLGLHLEPILLPLLPLVWLGIPLAPTLLVVQGLAVGLTAIPAARLAARHLGERYRLLGVAAALLHPTVSAAALGDFHPVTLAVPLLVAAVDALDEARWRRMLVFSLLALACREDIGLQLGALALWEGLRRRDRTRFLLIGAAVAGVAWFSLYVLVVQPRLLPPAGSYGLHFSGVGGLRIDSGTDLVRALLTRPLAALALLVAEDRPYYLLLVLAPLGALALLAPRHLVGALPIVIINLLSVFPNVRTLHAHYATAIAPFVIAAGIVGAGRLARFLAARRPGSRFASSLAPLVLAAAVTLAHLFYGATPLARLSLRWNPDDYAAPDNFAKLRAVVAKVPSGVSLAAHPGLLAHLAERPRALCPPLYSDGRPVMLHLQHHFPH